MAGDKARVGIIDQTSGKKYTVILPTNVPVSRLRPAIVKQLGLPTEGPGGAPMQYHLALESEGGVTRLEEDETLGGAHIQDGAMLRITPEMRAGAQETSAMRYFKLRLTRPDGGSLFETDFLVDHFDYFMREMASVLVRQKLFHAGELYNARIIPRADDAPSFDKPQTLQGKDIVDDGQGFLDILFEQTEPTVDPITYLTTHIHSKETDMIYRFDWRLDALLASLLRSVVQVLLDDGTLKDGDHFRYSLSAHSKGRPRIDPVAVVKQPVTTTPPLPEVQDKGEISVPVGDTAQPVPAGDTGQPVSEPAAAKEDLEIVIESVEELIKPESKSMKVYSDAELVWQVSDQDVPIFMRRGAREQAHKSAHVSAKAVEEVGGFLLGNVFRDPDTERLFVEISQVVEADQAKGTYVSLDFNYSAWRQVLDRIDKEFQGKIPVGWYHTHLVSQAVVLPAEGAESEYIARYVPFFSQPDLFIHRNFFPNPWNVGLVMDLRCGAEVFFAWREGDIRTTGFYVYGE